MHITSGNYFLTKRIKNHQRFLIQIDNIFDEHCFRGPWGIITSYNKLAKSITSITQTE